MKGKFDAYVRWPSAKKFQNWIVDWSTARDFMVSATFLEFSKLLSLKTIFPCKMFAIGIWGFVKVS